MDYPNNALNNYTGQLGVSTTSRPDTVLESVVSRLSGVVSRVHSSAGRANTIANAVIGFSGEEDKAGAPSAIPTSIKDYLAEIEDALNKLDHHLGRLG